MNITFYFDVREKGGSIWIICLRSRRKQEGRRKEPKQKDERESLLLYLIHIMIVKGIVEI